MTWVKLDMPGPGRPVYPWDLKVGDRITTATGRTGTITNVEPRGHHDSDVADYTTDDSKDHWTYLSSITAVHRQQEAKP